MTRTITVDIPDDDEAEATVRRLADQLEGNHGVLVFQRPTEIPPEQMSAIVQQVVIYLKAQAAIAGGLQMAALNALASRKGEATAVEV
jgi:hypothetical protein